ncbi:MAG: hypothetical protein H6811_09760 [Phycisphaeraceae bacterium]|nr:hypothetical protein [Phycisphaeraceae bacterium]
MTCNWRHAIARAVVIAAITMLAACGGGSDSDASDGRTSTSSRSWPGPSGERISAWIGEQRVLRGAWELASLEIEAVEQGGSSVLPEVTGRIRCTVQLSDDSVRQFESVAPPGYVVRAPNQETYSIVEVLGRKGTTMELFGTYTAAKPTDQWSIGSVELMARENERSRFLELAGGTARSAMVCKEVIERGSEREREFRAWHASEEQRLEDERQAVIRRREAERQRAIEEARSASIAAFATALEVSHVWEGVSDGFNNAMFFSFLFEEFDPETGAVSGTLRWRLGDNQEYYTRPITGAPAEDGRSIKVTEGEGEILHAPKNWQLAIYHFKGAESEITGTFERPSAYIGYGPEHTTMTLRPVTTETIEMRTAVRETLGATAWTGQAKSSRQGNPPSDVTLTLSEITEHGGVKGSIRFGTAHRTVTGMLRDRVVQLAEDGFMPDNNAGWALLSYRLTLSDDGSALDGVWIGQGQFEVRLEPAQAAGDEPPDGGGG